MDSQSIGDVFEKASITIFRRLFEHWGYSPYFIHKRQKSGTQFGFDIYFKLEKPDFLPIHVFIECKGSKTFNTIKKRELDIKSYQLKKSAFPKKDIHIYFSPTRTINYENDELPVDEHTYPFCVVDFTNKNGEHCDTFKLFSSLSSQLEVMSFLDSFESPYHASNEPCDDFESISHRLKQLFLSKVDSFLSSQENNDLTFMSGSYWNKLKETTDKKRLITFYSMLDSYKENLKAVVAHDIHVENKSFNKVFKYTFSEVKKDGGLIKILSNGGQGKSTFLLSIAKRLSVNHPVFYCNRLTKSTPAQLRSAISMLNVSQLPVLLIDDLDAYQNELQVIGEELANFRKGLIVIVAERYFRYNNIRNIQYFENSFFLEPKEIRYNLNRSLDKVYDKLFVVLSEISENELNKEKYKRIFLTGDRKTLAERIYQVLIELRKDDKVNTKFKFEWDVWEEWDVVKNQPPLDLLYMYVAAFYQFGNSISIEFLQSFPDFETLSKTRLLNAVEQSPNQPIIRKGDFLQLRHEKLGEWYINEKSKHEQIRYIYQKWLSNINSDFSKNLLLWTYRNYDFTVSTFKDLLPIENVKKLLVTYISNNPHELSARTELSKIYQQQNNWGEAEKVLLKSLEIDDKQLHARTELSKIYQQLKKWDKAEEKLLEYIAIDPNGLHPRTELSKIYQEQKKWPEAEKVLTDLLEIDKDNIQARTELSRIYHRQEKWKKAKKILKQSLKIDKNNLPARTELSKIYQRQEKWRKAKKILLQSIQIDKKQLHARTELSRIYQKQERWKKAKKILLESIEIDKKQLHARNELSKIFQQQGKWRKAKKILLQSIQINENNHIAFNELSKVYIHKKKWDKAINTLIEFSRIAPDKIYPHFEIYKIYKNIPDRLKAEEKLFHCLDIDPNAVFVRAELSAFYQEEGRLEDAEEVLRIGLQNDQNNAQLWYSLGKLHQLQNNLSGAQNAFSKGLKINKQHLPPYTELSKIYQQQKKWGQAKQILLQLLEIDKNNLHARNELGIIYQYLGKWNDARDILMQSLEINNDQLHARIELSQVYRKLNQPDQAELYLLRALEIEENNFRALTELSILYYSELRRDRLNSDFQAKLANSLIRGYYAKRDNIPLLNTLAKYLILRLEYRSALKVIGIIQEMQPEDLQAISLAMEVHARLGRNDLFSELIIIGDRIISKNPDIKFAEEYSKKKEQLSVNKSALENDLVGIIETINPYLLYILDNSGGKTLVEEKKKISKFVGDGDQVFYSVYENATHRANYIEPYLANIDQIIEYIRNNH